MLFLKTHKSGSTTLIAPFQKYAYLHSLSVMVPNIDFAMFNWPMEFSPNKDNIPAVQNQSFDMMVNHVIFNKSSIAPLMKPDTKYFTVMREPLAHLKSSFQYFGIDVNHTLGTGKAGLEKFLSDPNKYDVMPAWIKSVLPHSRNRVNSLTQNVQSADLGLMHRDFYNQTKVNQFIAKTMRDFHLILILERIHESLVLFRRIMNWEMKDIVFITKNHRPQGFLISDLSEDTRERGRSWCSVDQALYTAASQRLNQLISEENGIDQEVKVFKKVQKSITEFCIKFGSNYTATDVTDTLSIPQSAWNKSFTVDHEFCVLLLLDERDMTLLFKCQQVPHHRECTSASNKQRINDLTDMINGRQPFRYLLFPMIKPPVS